MGTNNQTITCPHCGKSIQLTEAFTHEIEGKLRLELDAEKKRIEALFRREFEERQKELRDAHAREKAKLEADAKEAARSAVTVEMADLRRGSAEKEKLLAASREQELALRARQRELEEEGRRARVEAARTIDAERSRIRDEALKASAEEHRLRELEKDKQLADMRKQIEELKRKAELTSQQAQGEVQEVELETILARHFAADLVEPVAKGVRGADILQRVRDGSGRPCGTIIWESKRTKAWSDGWVQKLRDDQRASKAEIAALVSSVLPKEVDRFGLFEGIWVSDFASAAGLATALRMHLIAVRHAGAAVEGRGEKMDLLYAYLSGTPFRQRVEAIVESFRTLREELDGEKRAMARIWSKREMQIDRVIAQTAGMYGDLQGIIGSALPEIRSLSLPEGGEGGPPGRTDEPAGGGEEGLFGRPR